jgi:hypothetical protein
VVFGAWLELVGVGRLVELVVVDLFLVIVLLLGGRRQLRRRRLVGELVRGA